MSRIIELGKTRITIRLIDFRARYILYIGFKKYKTGYLLYFSLWDGRIKYTVFKKDYAKGCVNGGPSLKRYISFFALLCALYLCGCGVFPDKSANISEPELDLPESTFVESSSAIPTPPRNPLALYPQKPNTERIMDFSYWRDNYLPHTIHGYQPNFTRGDDVTHYNAAYLQMSYFLAANGLLDQYEKTFDGYYIVPLDNFFYYIGKLFGENNTDVSLYSEIEDLIDKDKQIVYLIEPHYSYMVDGKLDLIKTGWFVDYWKCISIDIFTENGIEKVKLEFERYDDSEHTKLFRYETFVYFWDDELGFIVESSRWHWPETNRVSLDGNVNRLDTLFGKDEYEIQSMISIVNNALYVYQEDNALKCDILDLETEKQRIGLLIHDFTNEQILGFECVNNNIYVRTNIAAYQFNADLQLLNRKSLPASLMDYYNSSNAVMQYIVNLDISMISFSDDKGLYICELTQDAKPVLLQEHPYIAKNDDEIMKARRLYPITFTPENHVFAGKFAWESTDGFVDYDIESGQIHELNNFGTGYGSTMIINKDGALFLYPISDEGFNSYYYQWANQTLTAADWVPADEVGYESRWIRDDKLYCSYVTGYIEDDYDMPDKTVFLSVDTNSKQTAVLPFTVVGAEARVLAAGENGKILFWYGYKGENGFCVYDPQ